MFNVNTVLSLTPHIKPIVKFLLKCVPALCCLWLQVATALLFGLEFSYIFLEGEAHRPVLSRNPQKEVAGCDIWRPRISGQESDHQVSLNQFSKIQGHKTLFLVE